MLTKYSLQKQLVIIFSIIAIGVLAILLPIIDNNLTHVIDNEMYDVLTRSQNDFYSYDFSPDYAGSDKQIYHFTYNINEDTLTTAQNISAKKYQILDYVFQNDLYKMVKKNKKKLQEKVKMQDQTVYYQIVKADDSNYIISLVYSDYYANSNNPENRSDYAKKISPTTINNYMRNMKVFFNWCMEQELIARLVFPVTKCYTRSMF